jgi:hypothetical protein
MEHLSALAFEIRRFLATDGVKLSTGHAQQLVAAALGHNNLASYQASGDDERLRFAIDIVVDEALLEERAGDLSCTASKNLLVPAVQTALALRFPLATMHFTLDDFQDLLQEYVEGRFTDDPAVQVGSDSLPWAEMPLPWESIDPVGTSDLHGDLEGWLVSDDEDRRYSDNRVKVSGSILVRRLGRRLFGKRFVKTIHEQPRRERVR